MKSISYTFTEEEFWNSIKDVVFELGQDYVRSLIEDGQEKTDENYYYKFPYAGIKENLDEQLLVWCDFKSEAFFKNNPEVEDVLVRCDDWSSVWVMTRPKSL